MIQRCTNPKRDSWPLYGGRGITVCERWKKFDAFLKDMGEKKHGTSIDRIDPNGNYEPRNCRWATPAEQAFTRRKPRCVRCKTCKRKNNGPYRHEECHACHEYKRRNGHERPVDPKELNALKAARFKLRNAKPIFGVSVETKSRIDFACINEAVKRFGMGVMNCLSGRTKTAKGYQWFYQKGDCHDWIHKNPKQAEEMGLLSKDR